MSRKPNFSRGTVTITWSPRTTHHFNKLNSAYHVHRLVRHFSLAVDGSLHQHGRPVKIGPSGIVVGKSSMLDFRGMAVASEMSDAVPG